MEIVQALKGKNKKIWAFVETSMEICIQGQFFVLNKTKMGTYQNFECTHLKNAFFSKKKFQNSADAKPFDIKL